MFVKNEILELMTNHTELICECDETIIDKTVKTLIYNETNKNDDSEIEPKSEIKLDPDGDDKTNDWYVHAENTCSFDDSEEEVACTWNVTIEVEVN